MLFVRSLNGGVSHSPDELSSDDDVALGVDVLRDALARVSGGEARLVARLADRDVLGASPSSCRPSSRRRSVAETIVAKWFPASAPALLANRT